MQITNDTAAIVTGGASGLGQATARALAKAGAKVAIFDINEALVRTNNALSQVSGYPENVDDPALTTSHLP